jgi:hypothetical protein
MYLIVLLYQAFTLFCVALNILFDIEIYVRIRQAIFSFTTSWDFV